MGPVGEKLTFNERLSAGSPPNNGPRGFENHKSVDMSQRSES